jgi:hypothetical protein
MPSRHPQVLQLDEGGKVRRMNKKRRDLLREYHLQPRDLRRIDTPKSSPSISIKDNVLLLCLGGVRWVCCPLPPPTHTHTDHSNVTVIYSCTHTEGCLASWFELSCSCKTHTCICPMLAGAISQPCIC